MFEFHIQFKLCMQNLIIVGEFLWIFAHNCEGTEQLRE